MRSLITALVVLSSFVVLSSLAAGCDTPPALPDAGSTGGGSTAGGGAGGSAAGGSAAGGSAAGGSAAGGTALMLDTPQRILTFLEGKTLTMEGANIPTHPNGFNENVNFGASTQCYQRTVIRVMASEFQVTSVPGTLNSLDGGALMTGQVGRCDRTMRGPMDNMFTSMGVTLSNVQGNATCFDVDVNYGVFRQEGRATIAADGSTITMELFFQNGAVNHRCANGAVGATGVQLVVMGNMIPFTGDAKQKYVISQ